MDEVSVTRAAPPSTKAIVADEAFCAQVAALLFCDQGPIHDAFIGEPAEEVLEMVRWALSHEDDEGFDASEVLTNWAKKRERGRGAAGLHVGRRTATPRDSLWRWRRCGPSAPSLLPRRSGPWRETAARTGGPRMAARKPEVHHAAPRCLLTLHERANGAELDGEGIQAWVEWEIEAMRWRVPVEIDRTDLEALVEASEVMLERERHRLVHSPDWQRWGARGGRETLRRY